MHKQFEGWGSSAVLLKGEATKKNNEKKQNDRSQRH